MSNDILRRYEIAAEIDALRAELALMNNPTTRAA